ncbi:MAG: hypothetical protein WCZ17_05665 [Candidatus Kapaibacterium sp.]|nr:hypothetical protein [Candidatus Kapabacteria bacterium]
MKNPLLLIICLILSYSFTRSESLETRVGLDADYHYENNRTFLKNDNILSDCCQQEMSGPINKNKIGIFLSSRIASDHSIAIGIGYSYRNINVSANESLIINLDSLPIDGIFSHNFNLKQNLIYLTLNYKVYFGTVGLELFSDLEMPVTVSYSYAENLIKPIDRGYFTDTGTRRRNEKEGELDNPTALFGSIGIRLSREFPLDSDFHWIATPGISVLKGWNLFSDDYDMRFYSFVFGVSVSFTI